MGDLSGEKPILHTEDETKLTVLYREGGTWCSSEINKLCVSLFTEVVSRQNFPEYLVLFGHYTRERVLCVLGGGWAFTANQIVGLNNKELPFPVSWL